MIIKIPKNLVFVLIIILLVLLVLKLGIKIKISPKKVSQEPKLNPNQVVKEIEVTAKQFEFTPNPIRVKLGEKVRLKITSVDVDHGFSLPEFDINEILSPGGTISVEFQATEIGEFEFSCSVFCGSGHSNMRGKLIVE